MIGNLLKRIGFTNNPARNRRNRAERLFAVLEDKGALVLDKAGLEMIGMSRKQAFQSVYDLMVAERIQMRAEADGRVVAMSNAAFNVLMEERASETWRNEAALLFAGSGGAIGSGGDGSDFLSAGRPILPERHRESWISFE